MAGYRRPGKTPEIPASLHLPPVLYNMFKSKIPIDHLDKLNTSNYGRNVDGVAHFISLFEKEPEEKPIIEVKRINKHKKIEIDKVKKKEKFKKNLKRQISLYNPKEESKKYPTKYTEKPINTLFVGRLSYNTTEEKLKEVFSQFGKVKTIKLVKNEKENESKNRGYGFIEFEDQTAMQLAYKKGNRMEIDGKKILTDVERGRTVNKWLPRRLGGGLGGASRRVQRKRKRESTKRRD